MKRCPECRREYQDKYRFCQADRSPLVEVLEAAASIKTPGQSTEENSCCPQCAAAVRPHWKFCIKCRAPLTLTVTETASSSTTQKETKPYTSKVIAEPAHPTPTAMPIEIKEPVGAASITIQEPKPSVDKIDLLNQTTNSSTSGRITGNEAAVVPPNIPTRIQKEPTQNKQPENPDDKPQDEIISPPPLPQYVPSPSIAEVQLVAEPKAQSSLIEADKVKVIVQEPKIVEPIAQVKVADNAPPKAVRSLVEGSRSAALTHASVSPGYKESPAPPKAPGRIYLLVGSISVFLLAILIGAILLSRPSKQEETSQSNQKGNVTPSDSTNSDLPPPGMIKIPGGKFIMGKAGGDAYETPAHEVTVRPFYMDEFEVTCAEYQKFVEQMKYPAPPTWLNDRYPQGAEKLPITGVSWTDASAFALWAGKRLPTEEEWEFAARGTDNRLYPWGNEWTSNAANAGRSSSGRLVDVGFNTQGRSPYGLMDMVGNAWEWTASDLKAYPGGQLPDNTSDDLKVIRGGSWKEDENQATATYRGYLMAKGSRDYSATGFRCAQDISNSGGSR